MNSNELELLKEAISKAKHIVILLAKNADEDAIAAATALFLALKKLYSDTSIISDSSILVEHTYLFGVNKITKSLIGGNKLTVSFPYQEDKVKNASYDIKNGKLLVMLEGRGDSLSFRPEEVEYTVSGGTVDVAIAIGANSIEDLGSVYERNQSALENAVLVQISKTGSSTRFGKINLITSATLSQTTAWLLRELAVEMDSDCASNLYTGILTGGSVIKLETADADLLEISAFLIRSRARYLKPTTKTVDESPIESKKVFESPDLAKTSKNQDKIPQDVQSKTEEVKEEAPEDWLRPKVFTTDKTPNSL
jgi:hypothetical protein